MTLITPEMWQRLRNPSVPFVLGIIGFFIVVTAAILGPTVIKDGIENYQEIQRLREREFVPPPGAWIRPWLVERARIMIGADQPIEWRPTDFVYGPCAEENTVQLPKKEFREAIQYSCKELRQIQLAYSGDCAATNECNIPDAAREEIRAVIAVLDEAFAGAGFVGPVTREQGIQ